MTATKKKWHTNRCNTNNIDHHLLIQNSPCQPSGESSKATARTGPQKSHCAHAAPTLSLCSLRWPLWKDARIRALWIRYRANKFGRLMQGNREIEGTDTMRFAQQNAVPDNKEITYARMVCNIRPQKGETHQMRMTAGGDGLEYSGGTSTESASL